MPPAASKTKTAKKAASAKSSAGKRPSQRGGAASYNAVKEYDGKSYTGMRVGGSHIWDYQPGVWREVKVAPDRWEIDYQVNKVRKGAAPEGSGAPVGTEYHWFITAHQFVKKIDANTYSTRLVGTKYKLAHKWATAEQFNLPTETQRRKKQIELLEDAIKRVEELPPVKGEEIISPKKRARKLEKGQVTLDQMFGGGSSKKSRTEDTAKEGYDRKQSTTDEESFGGGEEGLSQQEKAESEVDE